MTVLDAIQKQADSLTKDLNPEEREAMRIQLEELAKKYKQLKDYAEEKQLLLAKVVAVERFIGGIHLTENYHI